MVASSCQEARWRLCIATGSPPLRHRTRCVRPDRVVVPPPALDDDLGLAESVEDFAVEQLVAQASVEALDVAVLPGAASLDVGGLGTDNRDPFLHGLGDELRSVVGPDVSGNALQDEEVGQNVDWPPLSGPGGMLV